MSNIIRYYIEEDGVVKGFLAVNFKKNLPHLQHFYIDKPYRNADMGRKLIKVFINIVKKLGYKKALVHACTSDQMKMIKYYFRKDPYGVNDGCAWYLVDIQGETL